MGHLYRYLGLTVGCLDDTEPGTPAAARRVRCDITYGTNNEFGFDYLRDNMVLSLDQRVQRPHWYAIVDEVDSVLIDEARTPLIISGPVGNENDGQYAEHNDDGRAARAPADRAGEHARRRGGARARGGRHGRRRRSSCTRRSWAARRTSACSRCCRSRAVQAARAADGARAPGRPQAAGEPSSSSATSRTTCCSCWTRRGTRSTSPTAASTSCRRRRHDEFVLPDISEEVAPDRPRPRHDRRGEARGAPGDRDRVRAEEREAEHRPPAAAGARAVREGRELRRAGGRGAHRRRVHRPHDAGPPLVARGCTRRSRPRKACR